MLIFESSLSSAWFSNFKQLCAFINCKNGSATYLESFSSGSDDFFHIRVITLLFFIKKTKDNHFQGGNNIIKHVNLSFSLR